MNNLSQRIKYYRKKRGLTMDDVASALGIRTDNYAKYESGARSPRDDRLVALSKILDVSLSALGEGAEQEFAALLSRHAVSAVLGRTESFEAFASDMDVSREAYGVIEDFFLRGTHYFAAETPDYFHRYINEPDLRSLIELYDAYIEYRENRASRPALATGLPAEVRGIIRSYSPEAATKWAFCTAVYRYLNGTDTDMILREARELSGNLDALQLFAVKVFVPYLSLIIDSVELCANTTIDDFANAFLFDALTPPEWSEEKDDETLRPYETPEIQAKLAVVKDAVLRAAPDTEAIYLFGSYVSGTPHKDSDLDVYVIVPDSDENPLDTEVSIWNALDSSFRMPMDLIVKHSGKFSRNKEYATFEKVVAGTGVRIYGR
jgi:transcriptional regulator with XRE-family HTH domain/predicted nucleotidyltransferase